MTTIHLTDAQRDTFAACGLIVIDGEPDGPDCVGGRRVVTLTATCSKCRGVGVSQAGAYACSAAGCLGSGVVTLGRFTIPALLPVAPLGDCPDGDHIELGATCAYLVTADGDETVLTLDPLPRPGQFIARPMIDRLKADT